MNTMDICQKPKKIILKLIFFFISLVLSRSALFEKVSSQEMFTINFESRLELMYAKQMLSGHKNVFQFYAQNYY